MCVHACVHAQSCPTLCNPMDVANQASCQWNFPDKTTGVGSHFLLQGIIPTQGSNLSLLHFRQILYHFKPPGKPKNYMNAL